ncbi:MAG TPA: hypothetical protein GXZ32_02970 [Clostridiales bacterium]|nr:hypothetical protein [Clostridiales bacterium]
MEHLKERVSYIRGLADGLGVDDTTNEGKILLNIVDLLDEMADAIVELDTSQSELDEYVEILDENLADVENQVYGYEEEDEEKNYIEVECPNCKGIVLFEQETFDYDDEDIICPNCNKPIYTDDEE